jgi:hypothetical protein
MVNVSALMAHLFWHHRFWCSVPYLGLLAPVELVDSSLKHADFLSHRDEALELVPVRESEESLPAYFVSNAQTGTPVWVAVVAR